MDGVAIRAHVHPLHDDLIGILDGVSQQQQIPFTALLKKVEQEMKLP